MTPHPDISLVIILYHPKEEEMAYHRRLAALYQGIVVDNSVEPLQEGDTLGQMHYVCNRQNLGIAKAQNIGIRWIMENTDCKYIVFLDQDTQIADEYPKQIADEYAWLSASMPLATLGPTVIDRITNKAYTSAFHKDSPQENGFIPRREIISSGSVASTHIFRKVGLMDSRLFIDYVDFEWCWRAKSKGYLSGITQHVTISHQVGRNEINIGPHKVVISAPFRYFYQYRNYLWLSARNYVPAKWKLNTGVKLLARIFYFPFTVKNWRGIEQNMMKGIYHGIFKR